VNVVQKEGDRMPIDFLMVRTAGDRWRAYDVKVAGMSLVSSYRSQFNKIIRRASYEELIKRLEAKTAPRDGIAGASPR
jgi:phospholipid transport system substrate-binding protein